MNKTLKRLSLLAVTAASSLIAGCNDNKVSFNRDYFFGMCEVSGDMNTGGVDPTLTNTWIADRCQALGNKSFRMWVDFHSLVSVDENDNVKFNNRYLYAMKDHVEKLYQAGVRRFLCMYSAFVYTKDYTPSTCYVAPDPTSEYDAYIRWLNVNYKATKLVAEEFKDYHFIFETGNEPDGLGYSCIHKNGYVGGQGADINGQYYYTMEEQVSILCDLSYYCRKGAKEADPEATVSFAGLTSLMGTEDYLEVIYQQIESKKLPAGQNKADTNPDHYFDYMNWHPYAGVVTSGIDYITDAWVEWNELMHSVMIKHGDKEKPVLFSEFGWTDWGNNDANPDKKKANIAQYYYDALGIIKEQLPWVETVFCFRMTNLYYQDMGAGENNFGIFYNPADPTNQGKAKPAALSIFKFFNGEEAIFREWDPEHTFLG